VRLTAKGVAWEREAFERFMGFVCGHRWGLGIELFIAQATIQGGSDEAVWEVLDAIEGPTSVSAFAWDGNARAGSIARFLGRCPDLRTVALRSSLGDDDADALEVLGRALAGMEHLESVIITGDQKQCSQGIVPVIGGLARVPTLRVLDVSNQRIRDAGLSALADIVNGCPSLSLLKCDGAEPDAPEPWAALLGAAEATGRTWGLMYPEGDVKRSVAAGSMSEDDVPAFRRRFAQVQGETAMLEGPSTGAEFSIELVEYITPVIEDILRLELPAVDSPPGRDAEVDGDADPEREGGGDAGSSAGDAGSGADDAGRLSIAEVADAGHESAAEDARTDSAARLKSSSSSSDGGGGAGSPACKRSSDSDSGRGRAEMPMPKAASGDSDAHKTSSDAAAPPAVGSGASSDGGPSGSSSSDPGTRGVLKGTPARRKASKGYSGSRESSSDAAEWSPAAGDALKRTSARHYSASSSDSDGDTRGRQAKRPVVGKTASRAYSDSHGSPSGGASPPPAGRGGKRADARAKRASGSRYSASSSDGDARARGGTAGSREGREAEHYAKRASRVKGSGSGSPDSRQPGGGGRDRARVDRNRDEEPRVSGGRGTRATAGRREIGGVGRVALAAPPLDDAAILHPDWGVFPIPRVASPHDMAVVREINENFSVARVIGELRRGQ